MGISLEEMRERFDQSPYARYLGMSLEELSPGYAKVRLRLRPELVNWDGRIQGGVLASLLDQAFGNAMNTLDRIHVATQMSINFVSAPEHTDTIYAEARVVHAGRSMGVAEITATDSKGKMVARALGTTVSLGPREG